MTEKEHFINYLNTYGKDVFPFYFSEDEIVLSWGGSDGPTITESGIREDDEYFIPFDETKSIDLIIEDGCKDSYFTRKGYSINRPIKTWTEYYKEVNLK